MKTLIIAQELGKDLRTRSFFRRDMERLINKSEEHIVLDFLNVSFISRSVADEIYNILLDFPNLEVKGMTGDVEKMYKVVVEGRNKPRVYSETKAKVFHLKNMKDLSDFFCTL